ncbi:MAG: hypothetical protein EP318_00725 [Rhodobacteraceae bacterium]|nr:MAG: hypothetical protein EP318_00725 [Paracoccaceae bacterium]
MSEKDREEAFLDALLDDERRLRSGADPEVPAGLMARVLADAERVQAGFVTQALPQPAPRAGLWAQIGAVLGGWPALAGLAAASVCGLWLGLNPPQGLSDTAAVYYSDDTALLDPVSGFEFAFEEI